ncbi:hypothetical protein VE01_08457 [Pseudogymnoascus verrucosus]|uniref:Uncharacterized protein n=1 Tax=Pseudogymnoascus verrucosus TaxID=342668 RepID=A0A1B8GBW1_9PEZI|nr:uncharacterized protein VE01_08457 [Pseudogymnoascus verrucosus]OBT93339.1 hypothetical protein VE01_08457 [Pseudogymnoascus verrucosus]
MKRALTHASSSLRPHSSINAVRYYFFSSTTSREQPAKEPTEPTQPVKSSTPEPPAEPVKVKVRSKTIAELDEELKLKLEEISGEGGAAGLEYENGKAVAMKRGVKDNMFRLI